MERERVRGLPHPQLLEIRHNACCAISLTEHHPFYLDANPEEPAAKSRLGREPPAGSFYFAVTSFSVVARSFKKKAKGSQRSGGASDSHRASHAFRAARFCPGHRVCCASGRMWFR